MSKCKWTKGPWRVIECDRQYIIEAESIGYDVAIVRNIGRQDNRANAHVISEAPELYSELAALQSWITDEGFEDNPEVAEMCGNARAALAKARGESQ